MQGRVWPKCLSYPPTRVWPKCLSGAHVSYHAAPQTAKSLALSKIYYAHYYNTIHGVWPRRSNSIHGVWLRRSNPIQGVWPRRPNPIHGVWPRRSTPPMEYDQQGLPHPWSMITGMTTVSIHLIRSAYARQGMTKVSILSTNQGMTKVSIRGTC